MIVSIAKAQSVVVGGAIQTAASALGSPTIGNPTRLTIGVETNAGTTLTVNVSYDDGQTWIPATLEGSSAAISIVLASAGALAFTICPAPYVQIVSSAACKISAWAYTS